MQSEFSQNAAKIQSNSVKIQSKFSQNSVMLKCRNNFGNFEKNLRFPVSQITTKWNYFPLFLSGLVYVTLNGNAWLVCKQSNHYIESQLSILAASLPSSSTKKNPSGNEKCPKSWMNLVHNGCFLPFFLFCFSALSIFSAQDHCNMTFVGDYFCWWCHNIAFEDRACKF